MIVVDTNILINLISPGQRNQEMAAVYVKDPEWATALLWKSEFRNFLATSMRLKKYTLEKAVVVMQEVERLMEEKVYEAKSAHVLNLAKNSHCSAYDCEFVSVAAHMKVPLITLDSAVLKAFPETAISPRDFLAA